MPMSLRQACERLQGLDDGHNPPVIKAHFLFAVLLPKLMTEIGINECTDQMARLFSYAMCRQVGQCYVCVKAPADSADDNLCVKCRAEIDQLTAEAGM